MRKLIVAEFISLDGVIQAPGGPDEDPGGGFRFGGWQVPYADEAVGDTVMELFSQPFELLLGRRTYDIWAAYWPHVRADSASHGIADLLRSTVVPRGVRVRTLTRYVSRADVFHDKRIAESGLG